ncbi:DUF4190 domain-containing protein [Streptomyces sp. NBC_01216]|uniref:DUF4190 domain-containing protein n=1 Tax=unclassified Streptomyces TaxID=2593676 RepID=UPI002E0DAA0D|nr:DUF4190 domain-containing protein [Streptomyces sp. NBC_01216]
MTTPPNAPAQTPWGPPPPMRQARNGLGIAAMVTGIVGLVLGIIPFLFWLGGVMGVVALVLGLVGHARARRGEASDKGAALAGVILGAVTIVVSLVWLVVIVVAVGEVADDMREEIQEQGTVTSAPSEPGPGTDDAPPAEDTPAVLAFGDTHTYEDGMKVTVSKPRAYRPDQFAAGHAKGNSAFQVTITIVNGSEKAVDITTALPSVEDADGSPADQVFDGSNASEPFTGMLLPGKQAKHAFTFSLPAGSDGEMQLEVGPKLLEYEDAIWTGPTK